MVLPFIACSVYHFQHGEGGFDLCVDKTNNYERIFLNPLTLLTFPFKQLRLMESGTIFYIIAVIIYFVYSFLAQKKAQNQEGQPGEADELPDEQIPSEKSFDDLLKDIRREQQERERDIVFTGEKPSPKAEPEPMTVLEERPKRKEETPEKLYDKLSQGQPLVKLDDQVDIHDDEKILGDVETELESTKTNPYAQRLKDPKSMREAIVITEILQRKHF